MHGLIRVLLLALPVVAAPGGTRAEIDARQVEECVERNLPEESGILDFSVRALDREGGATASAARLLWRRPEEGLSRVVLRVTEPEKNRGTAVLVMEQAGEDPALFVYLPAREKVKKVRKGRLRGPLFGTDFSYEDFERVQGLAQKTAIELRETRDLGGRSVWVLEARPDREAKSEYSVVFTYVDQATCLPLRMEFVDRAGELRKLLTSDPERVRRIGERFVPTTFVMRDLRDGTETHVSVEDVAIDPGLGEEQFTERALAAQSSSR